jgi:hypothetical protein
MRASSIAVGDPAQRAPRTIASYLLLVLISAAPVLGTKLAGRRRAENPPRAKWIVSRAETVPV